MLGYFNIVLHGHLPFVLSHGRWPHGADWLYEASAETYIPILMTLEHLKRSNIPVKITMGITPVLMEQLSDERFKTDFISYIDMKIRAATEDISYFQKIGDEQMTTLATMWTNFYSSVGRFFDSINRDIVGEFKKHHSAGNVEVITCAATHGYLPLLGTDNSVYAQLQVGYDTFVRHIGDTPKGIWLPEAAYRPRYRWQRPAGNNKTFDRHGIEEFLYAIGHRYFFVDTHLLMGGEAIGVYIDRFDALKRLWAQFERNYTPTKTAEDRTPYKPYLASSAGGENAAAFLTRDPETGLQVWSGEWGYPGNGAYLDFHKKRFPGGLRYWRVTDAKADLAQKEIYNPDWTEPTLVSQSEHYVSLIERLLNENSPNLKEPGLITAPYDAELFGHWWFEGPRWLEKVAKNIAKADGIEMATGWQYIERYPPAEVISLPEGSWGQGGFHYIWFNDWTKWTWEHIYEAEDIMVELANAHQDSADNNMERILNQLARELLLLESSDWQFLISTWSARDYAEERIAFHYEHFKRLEQIAKNYDASGALPDSSWQLVDDLEIQDSLFPNVDFRLWSDRTLEKTFA